MRLLYFFSAVVEVIKNKHHPLPDPALNQRRRNLTKQQADAIPSIKMEKLMEKFRTAHNDFKGRQVEDDRATTRQANKDKNTARVANGLAGNNIYRMWRLRACVLQLCYYILVIYVGDFPNYLYHSFLGVYCLPSLFDALYRCQRTSNEFNY